MPKLKRAKVVEDNEGDLHLLSRLKWLIAWVILHLSFCCAWHIKHDGADPVASHVGSICLSTTLYCLQDIG